MRTPFKMASELPAALPHGLRQALSNMTSPVICSKVSLEDLLSPAAEPAIDV